MGWKNTTYRREFSPLRRQVKQDYGTTYGQFVDYRFQRRQQEHRHEPFQWGEWEWANGGSESSENEAAEELQHGQKWAYRSPVKEPEHVRKHRTYRKQYEHAHPPRRAVTPPPAPSREFRDEEVQTPDWGEKKRRQKKDDATQTPEKLETEVAERVEKKKKPKFHPPKFRKIPPARPMSAPSGRPLPKNQPFVPFGMADREKVTGMKRTHNVRAPVTAVYPAALRAQRRRQAEIEKREEDKKKAPAQERKKLAVFNEQLYRETSRWDTEYRRNFVGYDQGDYARNRASVAELPKAEKGYVLVK